jgi:uncharacterized cupredoxin-like copper-binding protein
MMNIRMPGLLISAGVAGLLAVGACSSASGNSGGGGSSDSVPAGALVVEALDIKFDKKDYDASAGEVPIAYESKGQIVHTLLVLDQDNTQIGSTLRVEPGQTKVETFDLPAGTYELICDIPGHAAAGMKATLTVS